MDTSATLTGGQGTAMASAEFPNVTKLFGNRYVDPIMERMYDLSISGQPFRELASGIGEELGRYAYRHCMKSNEKVAIVPVLNSGMFLWVGLERFLASNLRVAGTEACKALKTQVCPIDMERKHRDDGSIYVEVYKSRLKGPAPDHVLVSEPMIATGTSLNDALELIVEWAPKARITVLSVLGAPQGLSAVQEAFPDVKIIIGDIAAGLDKDSYIVDRAIGDFGDRCSDIPSH